MQETIPVPNFPERESVGERPWGREDILVIVSGKYMLKHLLIKAGSKGGLQYHRLKDECGVLISGQLLIRYDVGCGAIVEKLVNPGEAFHFPPGCVHQEEAITDCVIIEGSTPHFNDRVRVEHKYDVAFDGGLPTTELRDIFTK